MGLGSLVNDVTSRSSPCPLHTFHAFLAIHNQPVGEINEVEAVFKVGMLRRGLAHRIYGHISPSPKSSRRNDSLVFESIVDVSMVLAIG